MMLLLAGGLAVWLLAVLIVLSICRAAARADEREASGRLVEASRRGVGVGLAAAAVSFGTHAPSTLSGREPCANRDVPYEAIPRWCATRSCARSIGSASAATCADCALTPSSTWRPDATRPTCSSDSTSPIRARAVASPATVRAAPATPSARARGGSVRCLPGAWRSAAPPRRPSRPGSTARPHRRILVRAGTPSWASARRPGRRSSSIRPASRSPCGRRAALLNVGRPHRPPDDAGVERERPCARVLVVELELLGDREPALQLRELREAC